MATPPVQKWEYKVVRPGIGLVELNALGEEGWELVLIIDKEGYPHRGILKRKLPPGEGEEG